MEQPFRERTLSSPPLPDSLHGIDYFTPLYTKRYLEQQIQEWEINGEPGTPPPDFLCPLSYEVMLDPVIISSGMTYEREYIKRWFEMGHKTCPKTNQTLDGCQMRPNEEAREVIHEWCKKNGFQLSSTAPVLAYGEAVTARIEVVREPFVATWQPAFGRPGRTQFRGQKLEFYRQQMSIRSPKNKESTISSPSSSSSSPSPLLPSPNESKSSTQSRGTPPLSPSQLVVPTLQLNLVEFAEEGERGEEREGGEEGDGRNKGWKHCNNQCRKDSSAEAKSHGCRSAMDLYKLLRVVDMEEDEEVCEAAMEDISRFSLQREFLGSLEPSRVLKVIGKERVLRSPRCQLAALRTLQNLSLSPEFRALLCNSRILSDLVEILTISESAEVRKTTSLLLQSVAISKEFSGFRGAECGLVTSASSSAALGMLLESLRDLELQVSFQEDLLLLLVLCLREPTCRKAVLKLHGVEVLWKVLECSSSVAGEVQAMAALLLLCEDPEGVEAVRRYGRENLLLRISGSGSWRGRSKASSLLRIVRGRSALVA